MADKQPVVQPGSLPKDKIPSHIAIIMDGNGRWARQRGLPRVAGHREGVKSVREIVEVCGELGVEVLTLYTFSTENWNRPKDEVSALMKLLLKTLEKEIDDLLKNNVCLRVIGDLDALPGRTRDGLLNGVRRTSGNSGLILNLALSYSGRDEIVAMIRSIGREIEQGRLTSDKIDHEIVSNHLFTADLPDPDLLIRTSGEIRISNFLLWQIAYAEIYVTSVLWPDFRKKELLDAIVEYQHRERRFGKVSEQINPV